MRRDQEYTKLYRLIEQQLLNQQDTTCKQIESKIYDTPLLLNMLGEDQLFLTDLYCSIQFVIKNKNLQQQFGLSTLRHPFNSKQNNYYYISNNRWHPYNCRQQILNSQTEQHNPHHPKFYFKQNFQPLKEQKQKNKQYFLPCFRIKITKWRFKIVNICKSGWYAPIIEAIDFKKEMNSMREDFKSISSILYQEKVKILMQRLRLQELRLEDIPKSPHQKKQVSLFYFLQDQTHKKKIVPNIFNVDDKKQILNFDKKNKLNYLLFACEKQTQGILALRSRVDAESIKADRLKFLNIQSLKVLFSNRQMIKPQQVRQDVWSSSDQDSEVQGDLQERVSIPLQAKDQSQEESDNEDPLRNLYIKQFERFGATKK